jgi:quinol monooxygenase YgiN
VATSVLVQMKAHPGQGDRMAEVLDAIMPDTLAAEGAISLELFRARDDTDVFWAVGRWREREDHEKYMAWRAETGIGHDDLGPLLAEYSVTYSDTIGEW